MDALKPQDPAHIGAHTLLARLGAGGMGQVYLGRSPGGLLVALKVIRDEIIEHPEALARFRREAETVRAVRSAYTANLIDASLDTVPLWLATEYVAGPTLSGAVAGRGAFPAEACQGLFAALAEALASVHAYGVTHRDLKPQNIILSERGPQLIDFGIARGAEHTALTRTGVAPGTPGFTAPEVLMRNEVGAAADVFALGATLAYAATGRPPFGSGPMDAVSYRAVHEPIDVDGVEPALAALITECAAKEPADRPEPAEIIRRCRVTATLTGSPFYVGLAELGSAAPRDLPTAVAAGLVPQGHGAPTPAPTPAQPTVGAGPVQRPTVGAGYVPTLAPDVQAVAARGRSRRGLWLGLGTATLVAGLATALVVQLLPGDEGGKGTEAGKGGGTSKTPSDKASGGATGKPPAYIENDRINRDFWTLSENEMQASHGVGQCSQISEERAPGADLQVGATDADDPGSATVSGRVKIQMRIKYAELEQKKPGPYYVSVGVKPEHDIDIETGRSSGSENKTIGYTSKPVDIYKYWKTGGWVELTYPDDFESHAAGKVWPSIPVENDPGDWTVLFYHVKGSPTDYASISCHGFRVG
ncbi:serine/threonine-protein kinase [Streptomyces boluensis]|uniref:Protein kinase n=1 Tax=Streptomyces boluensis TaxID=1775135 RepID=A0A964UJK2_9ACTN|nr:serine/threonine-protein kinase [Streptomyces boluensis]NBE50358.1 protein kinase [Streptomyces boluensis]